MTLDELIDDLTSIRQRLGTDAPVRLSVRENSTNTPKVDPVMGLTVSARHYAIHNVRFEEGYDDSLGGGGEGAIVLIESGEHAADVM